MLLKVSFPFFSGPHGAAYGILVTRLGIEPVPPAVEAQSLNHWTAREVSSINFIFLKLHFYTFKQHPER